MMPAGYGQRSLGFCLLCIAALTFSAWGFGKNKVANDKFSWHYLTIPHFNVYYHQDQGRLPHICSQWMENAHDALTNDFKFSLKEKLPFIIYGSANTFEQTNIINDIIPEGVGGFTTVMKNTIVVPFDGSYEELRHVLHHELIHGFQNAMIAHKPSGSFWGGSEESMPLWFAEGMAEYLSSGWNSEADMFLMDATIFGSVPLPGPQLDGYMAYKGGQSFLYFLASISGDSLFSKLLKHFGETKNAERAIKDVYGKKIEDLGELWHYQLKQMYWPEIGRRTAPSKNGIPLTNHTKDRDNFNLRPRVSPDGTKIAYFSDLKDFAKILIVNRSGKIIDEISQSGYAGSFESFHPFRTGVCWAPTSDRIAFVSKNAGKDELRIIDIKKKKLVQTLRPNLSGIFSPDWSSDGKSIVFCGVDKDYSDLFLCDLQTGSIKRLTNNIFFESDPRFSPSGKTVVFGRTDTLGIALRKTNLRKRPVTNLFSLNIENDSLIQLTHGKGNKKSPCFSPDGASLLYVCDINGIDNLYIAPIANADSAKPLTNILGGCQNPDWSKDSNTVVYCLFQKSGWDIWQISDPFGKLMPQPLAPTKWASVLNDSLGQFFEPIDGSETPKNIQKDSVKSLPTLVNFDSLSPKPYRVKFKPDLVMFGAGVNTYYGAGYAGQGVAIFSDLLGNHRITVAGDIQGNLVDYTHIFASYENLEHTINYGLGGFYNREYGASGIFGDSLFFDVNAGIILTSSYPFSMFSRLDFNAYCQNLFRTPYIYSGTLDKDTTKANQTFTIITPTVSYVYDDILWGITGPLNGTRSQATIEFSPPVKYVTSAFASFDLDFRKYFHIFKRFVWANKVGFGASVPLGGQETSVRKFFLGGSENWLTYQTNETGYRNNVNNFFYSQMIVPFRGWNYLDLTGTKYAVVNTELRFPFIKEFSIAWPLQLALRYINGALFADIGNAWNKEDEFKDIPLPKHIYGGIGYGLRANLGIFVVRYDYAWKTDWNTYVDFPKSYVSLGAEF